MPTPCLWFFSGLLANQTYLENSLVPPSRAVANFLSPHWISKPVKVWIQCLLGQYSSLHLKKTFTWWGERTHSLTHKIRPYCFFMCEKKQMMTWETSHWTLKNKVSLGLQGAHKSFPSRGSWTHSISTEAELSHVSICVLLHYTPWSQLFFQHQARPGMLQKEGIYEPVSLCSQDCELLSHLRKVWFRRLPKCTVTLTSSLDLYKPNELIYFTHIYHCSIYCSYLLSMAEVTGSIKAKWRGSFYPQNLYLLPHVTVCKGRNAISPSCYDVDRKRCHPSP